MRAEQNLAAHGLAVCAGAAAVAAYAGVGTEPPTRALLDALVATGTRVLVPVVDADDLGWGDYTGWDSLVEGPLALMEPAPSAAAASAARNADVVLVPALAVDRSGHRLGKGRGYYDRWLASIPVERRIAVVYADEVRDAVPHDEHDLPVAAALTPAGLVSLRP